MLCPQMGIPKACGSIIQVIQPRMPLSKRAGKLCSGNVWASEWERMVRMDSQLRAGSVLARVTRLRWVLKPTPHATLTHLSPPVLPFTRYGLVGLVLSCPPSLILWRERLFQWQNRRGGWCHQHAASLLWLLSSASNSSHFSSRFAVFTLSSLYLFLTLEAGHYAHFLYQNWCVTGNCSKLFEKEREYKTEGNLGDKGGQYN